eukprot:5221760-Amphidinium_carterae.1
MPARLGANWSSGELQPSCCQAFEASVYEAEFRAVLAVLAHTTWSVTIAADNAAVVQGWSRSPGSHLVIGNICIPLASSMAAHCRPGGPDPQDQSPRSPPLALGDTARASPLDWQ